MIAFSSSADFKDKLIEFASIIDRKEPSLSTIIPSRTSFMGMNSCVAFAEIGIKGARR
jgi:hypothetical protein